MNEGKETARNIFLNFDILTLKNSVRLLCSLDAADIEDFVKSYSSVIIFLLNILDLGRSTQLLEKLTNASIIYIAEEELRLHLIREIAHVDTPEAFERLSLYLDSIDNPEKSQEITGAEAILQSLQAGLTERKIHFAYLEALERKRADAILSSIIERNAMALPAILIYAGQKLAGAGLSALIRLRPDLLHIIPQSIIARKVRENYAVFLNESLFRYLPVALQNELKALEAFMGREKERLIALYEKARLKPVISDVLELVRELDPSLHDYFLEKLKHELVLSTKEIQLLQSYQAQKLDL